MTTKTYRVRFSNWLGMVVLAFGLSGGMAQGANSDRRAIFDSLRKTLPRTVRTRAGRALGRFLHKMPTSQVDAHHGEDFISLSTKAKSCQGPNRSVMIGNRLGLYLERNITRPGYSAHVETVFYDRPLEAAFGAAVEQKTVTFTMPATGIVKGLLAAFRPNEKVRIVTYRNQAGNIVKRQASSSRWTDLAKPKTVKRRGKMVEIVHELRPFDVELPVHQAR